MMNKHFALPRRALLALAAAATLGTTLGVTGTAMAQQWPTAKPIKIVVGFAPGGTTDVMARVIGQSLSESLGQSVVVDNKPGASGNVAATEVIRAPADGYTLLIAPTSVETANPSLFKQTILPSRDLTPVAGVGRSQMYLVVKPQSTVKDAKELVGLIKADASKVSYASAGAGTPPHLAGELFNQVLHTNVAHIPYRGAAPALQDVMANQVDYVFDPGISFPHVRAGKVRMLAVAGNNRSSFFPDVPTLAELGFKGAELDIWFGMWAPNGTPADVIARLNKDVTKALALATTKTRYEALGGEPVGLETAEFRKLLAEEGRMLSTLIKDRKIILE